MRLTIQTTEAPVIDWAAAGTAEIVQNVFFLINTFQYEIAYDRTLGLNPAFLDLPEQEAVAYAIAQLYAVIEAREPRAAVEDVTYRGMDEKNGLLFEVVIEV